MLSPAREQRRQSAVCFGPAHSAVRLPSALSESLQLAPALRPQARVPSQRPEASPAAWRAAAESCPGCVSPERPPAQRVSSVTPSAQRAQRQASRAQWTA